MQSVSAGAHSVIKAANVQNRGGDVCRFNQSPPQWTHADDYQHSEGNDFKLINIDMSMFEERKDTDGVVNRDKVVEIGSSEDSDTDGSHQGSNYESHGDNGPSCSGPSHRDGGNDDTWPVYITD